MGPPFIKYDLQRCYLKKIATLDVVYVVDKDEDVASIPDDTTSEELSYDSICDSAAPCWPCVPPVG
jgi:hypothetical protein